MDDTKATSEQTTTEEFKLTGDEVVKKVKEIIKEGNARRIIIKNEKEVSVLEIPVTLGVVGILLAPYLAAVGALAAVLTNCSIVVERRK
ncbi:hypothetical protein DOJK_01231 [Patescibacteria group bacterium]|jgi:hypothetical protein|nr:hypothetical protein DOJK_01231 [Patescibacteria group bacterium]